MIRYVDFYARQTVTFPNDRKANARASGLVANEKEKKTKSPRGFPLRIGLYQTDRL